MPQEAHVVAPHHRFVPESYRLDDYAAYYRLVKKRLEAALDERDAVTYPEPAQHCDVCNWWVQCNARRRADDHLSFVAGISRLQIKELRTRLDVDTLERLGDLEDRAEADARLARSARAHARPGRDPAQGAALAGRASTRCCRSAPSTASCACRSPRAAISFSTSKATAWRSRAGASICSASATRAAPTRRSGRRTRPRRSAPSSESSIESSPRSRRTARCTSITSARTSRRRSSACRGVTRRARRSSTRSCAPSCSSTCTRSSGTRCAPASRPTR